MSALEKMRLHESALQLREIARVTVKLAPSSAAKASALASELELKIRQMELLAVVAP